MADMSTKQAAIEAVRRAAQQMLDFSDSDERPGAARMAEVVEDALNKFGAQADLFSAPEGPSREDGLFLSEIEKEVRQIDEKVGSLCGNPGIYLRLGNGAYYQREDQIALENYEKALRISPKCSEAWAGKGCILLREHKYKDAEACFDRALEEEPDNPEILYSKAFTAGSLGKLSEAVEYCDRALTLNPQVIKIRDFLDSSIANDPAALKTFSRELFN